MDGLRIAGRVREELPLPLRHISEMGERRMPFRNTVAASSLRIKRVGEGGISRPTKSPAKYFQMPTIVSECYRGKLGWWLPDLGSNQGPAD